MAIACRRVLPLALADVCASPADMYRTATQDTRAPMDDGMSIDEVLTERARMKKEAMDRRKQYRRDADNENAAKSSFQNPMAVPDSDDSDGEAD